MAAAAGGLGVQELWLFIAATFVLNATPGVDLLLTVSRTLRGGVRAGVAAALGISAGCLLHALAAALGLASLLALSPRLLTLLQWAGAAYLLGLALGMARRAWRGAAARVTDTAPATAQATGPADGDAAAAAAAAEPAGPRPDRRADFRAGLWTNLLNPKVVLFFLAFLPQFVAPDVADKTAPLLLLGLLFATQSLLFLFALVLLCGGLLRLRRRWVPRGSAALGRLLEALGAGLFAVLAWRLLGLRAA